MSLPVRVTVTAKVEAVTPEGGEGLLVEFLRAYRDAVQLVVDGIWGSRPSTLREGSAQNVLQEIGGSRVQGPPRLRDLQAC
jgi:hypothetical protein